MKKVILLLNSDRYYYPGALDAFLSKNANRISKIFVFPAFIDARKKRDYERASMRIMGPHFVIVYLARVVSRVIFGGRLSSINSVARHYHIPLELMSSVNSPELVQEITREGYEVGLSMVSQIYTGEILALPRFALYNFHPSLLPRNKGKYPIFWAFLRQEKEQGITCHQITKKIDDGQIIFQKQFKMKAEDTVVTVLNRFVNNIPAYLEEAMQRIDAGSFEAPFTNSPSFYGPTPTKKNIQDYWQIIRAKNTKGILTRAMDQVRKNYGARWYPPVMSLLTASNVFMVILPVEAILVGGILLRPKTWAKMAFWQTVAATLSTMVLALLVVWKGQVALDWLAPNIQQSLSWIHAAQLMRQWGLAALSVMSILPVPILPGIAFAVFAKVPLFSIFYAVLAGRAIKFYGLCFLAAYFPQKLRNKKSKEPQIIATHQNTN